MKLSYNQKAGIVKYALPMIVIVPFAIAGYRATHQTHAQSVVKGTISVTTDKQVYQGGQSVSVTVANATNSDLYVDNNCPLEPLEVDYQMDGTWQQLRSKTVASKCQGEPAVYKIPAHASITTDYRYWPELFDRAGMYRIYFRDRNYGASTFAEFKFTD